MGDRRKRRWVRRLLRYGEHMLAAAGAVLLIYHLAFDLSVVVSGSMAPALNGESYEGGERVLTENVSYWFRRPRRWEVVRFTSTEFGLHLQVMKRVVGLPGETVSLKDGQVCIDGEIVTPPESLRDLRYVAVGNVWRGKSVACGDGYYVLGDDTKDSEDSRYCGPIPPSKIRGRAWLVVSPSQSMRFVNP